MGLLLQAAEGDDGEVVGHWGAVGVGGHAGDEVGDHFEAEFSFGQDFFHHVFGELFAIGVAEAEA